MTEFNRYEHETKTRFGNTEAYKEYEKRYVSPDAADGLMSIFTEFSECKKNGYATDSEKAQTLVKKLQDYITENYYTCTKEILAGLGQLYVSDERFKTNIDKYGINTADFTSKSIEIYVTR